MTLAPTSFLSCAHERLRRAAELWTFYAFVVLLAYGFTMFNLLLVSDDWQAVQANFQSDLAISVGRWMDTIIWYLANDDNFAPTLTLGVLAAAYLAFAAACGLCLGLKRPGSYLIFSCLFICFPFNAEPLALKDAHLIFTFAIMTAIVSGLLMVRGYELLIDRHTLKSATLGVAAAATFAVSAAAYQTHALLAAALVLARTIAIVRESNNVPKLLRSVVLLFVFSAAVLGMGLLLYMESIQIASWLSGIPLMTSGRYAVSNSFVDSWGELLNNTHYGLHFLRDLLVRAQRMFPAEVKLVFLAMTAALIGVIAFDFDKPSALSQSGKVDVRLGIVKAATVGGVVVLLFLTPLALGFVRKAVYYRYNNLIGIAVPYAAVFALLFDTARGTPLRRWIAAISIAITAIFIFEQNRASVTTFLLNRRDLAVASQMLGRITANPAFAPFAGRKQATIVFYGTHLDNRRLPRPFSVDGFFPNTSNDCGPFNCQMTRIQSAFRLISAGDMAYSTHGWPLLAEEASNEEKQLLEQRVKEAHPWPAPDAVIFGTTVIVVMLQPARHR